MFEREREIFLLLLLLLEAKGKSSRGQVQEHPHVLWASCLGSTGYLLLKTTWFDKVTGSEGRWNVWKKREPKIIHFAGLPEDTETDLLSFRKEKKCKGPQWFLRRFETAKRCPSVWVQNAASTRCLLCQKMMPSPVTAWAISGSWCLEHTHIISREKLFSPTWGTEEMLQWQQKSRQVKRGILEWQESSSDSYLLLMDIWREQSNLLTASYSCHWEKTVHKGWMPAER